MNITPVPASDTIIDSGKTITRSWNLWLDAIKNEINTLISRFTSAGELKAKIYKQDDEPTLSVNECLAVWVKNDGATYLVYKYNNSTNKKVQLT